LLARHRHRRRWPRNRARHRQDFGARGFRVALLSRDPARQEPTVAALAEEGVEAVAFRADAGDPASLAAGLAAAKQRAR